MRCMTENRGLYKKMIMKALQDSMNKNLQWINCRVSVVDSDTYNSKIFRVVN